MRPTYTSSISIRNDRRVVGVRLAREAYFAAAPMALFDADRRLLDFNVALHVLLGTAVESCRNQDAALLCARVAPRTFGSLLGATGMRDRVVGGRCRLQTTDFGWADLTWAAKPTSLPFPAPSGTLDR